MMETTRVGDERAVGAELSPLRSAAVLCSYYLGLAVELVAGILLVCAAVFVVSQVFCRYVLESPLDWTEEAARYTAVWAGLLGAALGVRSNTHFRVLLLVNRFGEGTRRAVEQVCRVIITVMLLVIVWTSIRYVLDIGSIQESPGLQISMAWLYSVVPVSTVLMLIFMFCEAVGGSVRPLWTEERTSEAELIEKIVEEAERAGGLVVGEDAARGARAK